MHLAPLLVSTLPEHLYQYESVKHFQLREEADQKDSNIIK